MLWIFTSECHFYYYLLWKAILLSILLCNHSLLFFHDHQYSSSPNCLLWEEEQKGKLLSKLHLPTTVPQWWIPPVQHFNCINIRNEELIIFISLLKYFIWYFALCFTLSLIWFNATSWANLSLSFACSKGVISFLKLSEEIYHQWSKMHMIM